MNKEKLYKFLTFIPFAVAFGSFILYFKYLFAIKSVKTLKVTQMMEVSLVRYRNIGVFCLAIGVLLLFIKTLIEYLKINDNNVKNEGALDRISNKRETIENKYSLNESSIINDLLAGKTIKAIFYSTNVEEKIVKFKNYYEKNNLIEFYDMTKKNTNEEIKKDSKKVMSSPITVKSDVIFDSNDFKECSKCKNMIAKDAIICVHCGTIIKEKVNKEKKNSFDPVRFALNMIIILLCIILLLLSFTKIKNQSEINKDNFNVKNIKTVETR